MEMKAHISMTRKVKKDPLNFIVVRFSSCCLIISDFLITILFMIMPFIYFIIYVLKILNFISLILQQQQEPAQAHGRFVFHAG